MELEIEPHVYSGTLEEFNRWRVALALAAEYEVAEEIPGFPTPIIDWESITDEQCSGEWGDARPSDPLIILIAHYDNSGVIHPPEAKLLHDRLIELYPKLDNGHYRYLTEVFTHGLVHSYYFGDDVEFKCNVTEDLVFSS